jgi:hypothetical protein
MQLTKTEFTKTQYEYALSLIRRFHGVAVEHILSVLHHQREDKWPEVMHTLKTTQPRWFVNEKTTPRSHNGGARSSA